MLAWVENGWAQQDDLNDYQANVVSICQAGEVGPPHIGYAASLISTYRRWLAEQEKGQSVYFGQEGERYYDVLATCVWKHYLGEGQYGERWLNKFEDEEDHIFIWFTSYGVDEGLYEMNFRVINHTEFGDEKQTIISRSHLRKVNEEINSAVEVEGV